MKDYAAIRRESIRRIRIERQVQEAKLIKNLGKQALKEKAVKT